MQAPLIESDVLEHLQWSSADSALDFSSTVGVKDLLFILSTFSYTVSPKPSLFYLFHESAH